MLLLRTSQVVEGMVTMASERMEATGRGLQDTGVSDEPNEGEEVSDWHTVRYLMHDFCCARSIGTAAAWGHGERALSPHPFLVHDSRCALEPTIRHMTKALEASTSPMRSDDMRRWYAHDKKCLPRR